MQDGTRCRCGSMEWRPYGGYRRKGGERVERVCCLSCKRVRVRGVQPRGQRPGTGSIEAERGLDAFGQFWLFFPLIFCVEGLPGAIRWARSEFEANPSTVTRWITRVVDPKNPPRGGESAMPRFDGYAAPLYEILEECLRLRRGDGGPLPQRSGVVPGGPIKIGLAGSTTVWHLLVRARGIAALLRGGSMPSWLDSFAGDHDPLRRFFPLSAWRLRVKEIQQVGKDMRAAIPDQAWDTPAVTHWLRGWADPARHHVLTRLMLRMEESPSADRPHKPRIRSSDGEQVSEALYGLLREYPIPAALDRKRLEAFLEQALGNLWTPGGSDLDVERGLGYWLRWDRKGFLHVIIATRRRVVGTAGPAYVDGFYGSGTQRLDPMSLRAVGNTVEIPFSSGSQPVIWLKKGE